MLTHFYLTKRFWNSEYKRREICENQVKNIAKLLNIQYLDCLKLCPNQQNFCLCSTRFLNKVIKKNHFFAHLAHFAHFSFNQIQIFTFIHIITCPFQAKKIAISTAKHGMSHSILDSGPLELHFGISRSLCVLVQFFYSYGNKSIQFRSNMQ